MKELVQLQNQLKEEKELTITLEAQLLTVQEELNNLTIKINHLPTWEKLTEIEIQRDQVKQEYSELKVKLAQITHEKQVLEVQFEDLAANRFTSEEIKLENQKLTKSLTQSQNKIKELEKQVKEFESELLTEQVSNKMVLESEQKRRRIAESELEQKQTE
jgi:hypothetical protein